MPDPYAVRPNAVAIGRLVLDIPGIDVERARAIAESDRYLYGADVFIPDVLLHLDLPAIAAAIAPRPLKFLAPQDAMKKAVDSIRAYEVYRSTREAYEACGAAMNFQIEDRTTGENEATQLLGALRDAADGGRLETALAELRPRRVKDALCGGCALPGPAARFAHGAHSTAVERMRYGWLNKR